MASFMGEIGELLNKKEQTAEVSDVGVSDGQEFALTDSSEADHQSAAAPGAVPAQSDDMQASTSENQSGRQATSLLQGFVLLSEGRRLSPNLIDPNYSAASECRNCLCMRTRKRQRRGKEAFGYQQVTFT